MEMLRISILGAGVLLAASGAAAEIVYVNPPDIVVTLTTQSGDLLKLDLDRDGQPDYALFGAEFVAIPGDRYIGIFDAENWVGCDANQQVRGFQEGETITRETSGWTEGDILLSTRGEGAWASGEVRFLGFFLRTGTRAQAVVGWIRLRALPPPVPGALSLVVYDYAYQSQPDQDIRAGEKDIVPVDPTTWGAIKHLYAGR